MAIVVDKFFLKDGLGGTRGSSGSTIDETALIVFDTVVDDPLDAISFSGFKKGQQHRSGKLLFLSGDIDADVLQDDTGKAWTFLLSYSTKSGFDSADNDDPDTGTYRPEVKLGKWTYTRVVDRDKVTGDLVANTAGDVYDPLPVETISAPTISITVQEYSAHMERLQDLGSINSAAITIAGVEAPKYCAMFDDYQTVPYWDTEQNLTFKNTFTFKMKYFQNKAGVLIGFTLEAASQGFNSKDVTAPNNKVEIKVADPDFPTDRTKDVPVATPQLLDADGLVTAVPFYQEFVVHDILDFSVFSLPTSYPVD